MFIINVITIVTSVIPLVFSFLMLKIIHWLLEWSFQMPSQLCKMNGSMHWLDRLQARLGWA